MVAWTQLNLKIVILKVKEWGRTLCIAWHEQDNVPIQIVRPAITYGPGVPLDDGRSYADFIKSIV